MAYIRTRTINIDVIPNEPNPFISMNLEKVLTDSEGNEMQVIGNFDRIVKRLSDIEPVPVGDIADDGMVSALELFTLIADHVHVWIIEKYGGKSIMGGVEVD